MVGRAERLCPQGQLWTTSGFVDHRPPHGYQPPQSLRAPDRSGTARRRASLIGAATTLLVVGGLFAGCVSIRSTVQARDTLDLGLAVAAGTPLRVETFNGGIEVTLGSGFVIAAAVERTGEDTDTEAAEADRDAIAVTLELVDGVALLRRPYAESRLGARRSRSCHDHRGPWLDASRPAHLGAPRGERSRRRACVLSRCACPTRGSAR